MPGGRGIPLWALGAGAIAAVGFFAVSRLRGGGAGGAKKVNVTGLQTNQFFQALTQQATRTQELFAQQGQRFQAQLTQQATTTQGQITSLQATLTGQIGTLSQQMQTQITSVSTQLQANRSDIAKLREQVNQLAAHETRVNTKQAEVFRRAWVEMGSPVTQIEMKQGFANPEQYGIGPSSGITILPLKGGQPRYEDVSDFGTKIQ